MIYAGHQDALRTAGMESYNWREHLAAQHHRLHIIELWPDGPRKQTAIAAIQSTIDSLSRLPATPEPVFVCILCQSRKANVIVLEPSDSEVHARLDNLKRTG